MTSEQSLALEMREGLVDHLAEGEKRGTDPLSVNYKLRPADYAKLYHDGRRGRRRL